MRALAALCEGCLQDSEEHESSVQVQNDRLRDALFETISVLERNKDAYKSEKIETIREKLKGMARE